MDFTTKIIHLLQNLVKDVGGEASISVQQSFSIARRAGGVWLVKNRAWHDEDDEEMKN